MVLKSLDHVYAYIICMIVEQCQHFLSVFCELFGDLYMLIHRYFFDM